MECLKMLISNAIDNSEMTWQELCMLHGNSARGVPLDLDTGTGAWASGHLHLFPSMLAAMSTTTTNITARCQTRHRTSYVGLGPWYIFASQLNVWPSPNGRLLPGSSDSSYPPPGHQDPQLHQMAIPQTSRHQAQTSWAYTSCPWASRARTSWSQTITNMAALRH